MTSYLFINALCAAILLSSLGVIYSKNSLHSILFLVATFFFSSMTIFFLENEFLALFVLIIYIGAVMVLFLFVVMMLDLKHNVLKVNRLHFLTGVSFTIVSVEFLGENVSKMFFQHQKFYSPDFCSSSKNWDSYLDQTHDMLALSSAFYHNYAAQILVVGLLLYIVVIGVVFLTTSKYKRSTIKSRQSLTRQLSRNSIL